MSLSGKHFSGRGRPQGQALEFDSPGLFRLATLKARLAVALVFAVLLPAAIALPFQYLLINRNAEEAALQQLLQLSAVQQRRVNRELARLIDGLGLVTSRTQLRISLDRFNQQPDATEQRFITQILDDAVGSNENIFGASISDLKGEIVSQTGAWNSSVNGLELMTHSEGVSLFPHWSTGSCDVEIRLSAPLMLDEKRLGQLSMQVKPDVLIELLTDFPDPGLLGATYIALRRPDGERCALIGQLPESANPENQLQMTESALLERIGPSRPSDGETRRESDGSMWLALPLEHDFGDLVLHSNPQLKKQLAASVIIGYGLIVAGVVLISLAFTVWLARWLSKPFEHLSTAIGRANSERGLADLDSRNWPQELKILTSALAAAFEKQGKLLSAMRREVTRRRAAQSKLVDLANSDELTGLANRRFFIKRLKELLNQPEAEKGTLLYLDLDRFKPVNDQYGHEAGDLVLKVVAERIQNAIRGQDLAARLGGDEFAALLLDNDETNVEAQTIADRIEVAVSQPINCGSATVSVGCSIGAARLKQGRELAALLNEADSAMYAVKQRRRDNLIGVER
ncbi:MAG: GGDEF domain-containing protein [Wenzhouxiangella sp.]|jgi:diguanylate cyclase (GGDEF)-like protein|nr:GGDEF domain-containing protein [Wenzhouxiangella sp.]